MKQRGSFPGWVPTPFRRAVSTDAPASQRANDRGSRGTPSVDSLCGQGRDGASSVDSLCGWVLDDAPSADHSLVVGRPVVSRGLAQLPVQLPGV
ncbi:hypothetical protein P7K49_005290 [Saguinus oedipus]|uniref:Uncharacterized protein n=1 Tax=Saguinus oedipus TaxID=9490 RepID=A0ABQ9WC98_SAGOE|nr:hypothetical protein P7K49_005290 [Saguinus oedipus]